MPLAANFGELLSKKWFSCLQEISQGEKHTVMVIVKKEVLQFLEGWASGCFVFYLEEHVTGKVHLVVLK